MMTGSDGSSNTGRAPSVFRLGFGLVVALYLVINVALLRVLAVPELVASKLPVATAAQVVLPRGGALLITAPSILIVLSLINANAAAHPMSRLQATTLTSCAMILTGTFSRWVESEA